MGVRAQALANTQPVRRGVWSQRLPAGRCVARHGNGVGVMNFSGQHVHLLGIGGCGMSAWCPCSWPPARRSVAVI